MIDSDLDVILVEELAYELHALLDSTVTLCFWEDALTFWVTAYGLSPWGDLSVDIPFSIRAAKSLGARKAALWLEPIVLHEFKKRINSL